MNKSSTDKVIAGVCGSLAQYTGIDSFFIRIGVVLATLSTGIVPGIFVYVIAASLMK